MKSITKESNGLAWLELAKTILDQGHEMHDGDTKLLEFINVTLQVKKPSLKDVIIEKHCSPEMLQWMADNFREEKLVPELSQAKSYGWRLRNYEGQNQIQKIIDKLRKKRESKSATITTLMADDVSYVPCVSLLDWKVRNGQLLLFSTCRSLDVGRKMPANLLELTRLHEEVAKALELPMGPLSLWIVSGHVYEKDLEYINKLLDEVGH